MKELSMEKHARSLLERNTTGIENVVSIPNKLNNTTKGIYDISGRKLPALQHGINIVISEDGTRRKIYKK